MNTNDKKPDMKAALFSILESMPVLLEHVKLDAKITRAKFLALVKEGFTEAQAIELLRPKA